MYSNEFILKIRKDSIRIILSTSGFWLFPICIKNVLDTYKILACICVRMCMCVFVYMYVWKYGVYADI